MGMLGMILIRLLLMIESVKINGVAFSKSKKLISDYGWGNAGFDFLDLDNDGLI